MKLPWTTQRIFEAKDNCKYFDIKHVNFIVQLIGLLICIVLSLNVRHLITEEGVRWNDDREHVSMAYNLYKHGVLSISREEVSPPRPSCHREPMVPWATALFMRLYPRYQSDWTLEEVLRDGPPIKTIKYVNLVWVFLSLLGAWWTLRLFGGNLVFCSLAVFLIYGLSSYRNTDVLMAEIPAAACLLWSGVFLLLAYDKKSWIACCVAGAVLGLLALTKAVFYFVFFPIPFILMALLFLQRVPRKQWIFMPILLCLGFGLVVYPYMFRNYSHFDQFKITDRGGRILLIRAYKNDMTWTEIKGAFFHWAPRGYQPAIGKMLGFSDADLMRGGVLQRLNRFSFVKDPEFEKAERLAAANGRPEDTITLLLHAGAERIKSYNDYKAAGSANPAHDADRYLQEKAIRMIKEKPFRHILLTPLFFWRGIGEIHSNNPWLPSFLRGGVFRATVRLLMFISLFFLPLAALYRRKCGALLFTLPAIGMILFYAFFTHNVIRYPVPAYPVMIISFCVLVHWSLCDLYTMMRRRLKRVPAISES